MQWDVIQSLQWRHNERDGVSNHQPRYCLLKRLFRRRSKKTSKLRVTGLCEGNYPVTPHKGPVKTRKMFSFRSRHHDVKRWQYEAVRWSGRINTVDQSHKSPNAINKYPTMHSFVTEMCTVCTLLLQNCAWWDICLMHCGIWDRCIVGLSIPSIAPRCDENW